MPPAKTGLGRGLGALIPGAGAATAGVEEVDLDLISPNPEQPRRSFDDGALDELAQSIREHGILQPLLVTRLVSTAGAVTYRLIAGERRLLAARRAGLRRAPVLAREATTRGLLELALVENLQRAALPPLDAAEAYRRLTAEFQLTQEQVAARIGKSRVAVANTVRLLGLPAPIRAALAEERISEGHARALLGLPDDPSRLAVYAEVTARDLSVRATEELVRRLRDAGSGEGATAAPERVAPRARPADPNLTAIEERLRAALGTQVRLERGRKGGRIVIQFYGDEDLEGLLTRLLGDDEEEDA